MLNINLDQEGAMRKVVYGGAMSLDGFIAGPNDEFDWILRDPDIDFAELMARFDTFLIGRRTFEVMRRMGNAAPASGMRYFVFSRSLRPEECPDATLSDDAERVVAELRRQPGKDIALFGGGSLFRNLLAAGLVDLALIRASVEIGAVPGWARLSPFGAGAGARSRRGLEPQQ
jgi:dihydrofolate reductase